MHSDSIHNSSAGFYIFTTFEIYIVIFWIGVDSALKSLHGVDVGSVADFSEVVAMYNFRIQIDSRIDFNIIGNILRYDTVQPGSVLPTFLRYMLLKSTR
jgi:hypothetical protein